MLLDVGKYILNILILQEPNDYKTVDLGKAVELSVDLNVQVKLSDEKLQYQWWFEDDDERYKLNDSGELSIQEFEKDYEGKYKLVVSTFSEPVMSVSTEVQLKLTGKIALNQWVAYCDIYTFL